MIHHILLTVPEVQALMEKCWYGGADDLSNSWAQWWVDEGKQTLATCTYGAGDAAAEEDTPQEKP